MSLHLPVAPGPGPAGTDPSSAGAQAVGVEVLVCGSPDRGDDGVAVAAAAMIRDQLPDGVRMRTVGQLDIDDLLAVPAAVGVVIVDAASGLRPGQIVDLPLTGLIGRPERLRPRSSHAVGLPEVVALAELIQGRPVHGRIVAVGAVEFGLGSALSRPVAAAMPGLVLAILGAIAEIRTTLPREQGL